MPLISVIVPVYKVEKYLHRCVNSILIQSFTDFELILVDDGSPDRCGIICDEYADFDNHVRVIHQANGGLSAARNAGINWSFDYSDSEWITFIDSDDWVHPQYLEVLYQAAISQKVDVVVGGYEMTEGQEPDSFMEAVSILPQMLKTEDFYVYNIVNATVAWGKLYRKEFFRNIKYPLGKLHEDEFTTYRILFQSKEVCVIRQPLYAYFQNQSGIILRKWTPKRFDSIIACEGQVKYFADYGYLLAGKERFRSLIRQLLEGKDHVASCDELSEIEKKKWKRKLDLKKKKVMIKYHKYKWITLKDKGFFLQAYDSIFPPFKVIRKIGLAFKWVYKRGRRGDKKWGTG